MNTIVVSAFPGTGKTYCTEHNKGYKIVDSDSSSYNKDDQNWAEKYASDIEAQLGTVDIIFVSQHDLVREALQKKGIQFITIAPEIDQFTKETYIGSWLLRDNSHIKDLNKWMKLMIGNYDKWVSQENQKKYGAKFCFRIPAGFHIYDYLDSIVNLAYLRNFNANFIKLPISSTASTESNGDSTKNN